MRELSAGSQVFFNAFGSSRSQAGSAVSEGCALYLTLEACLTGGCASLVDVTYRSLLQEAFRHIDLDIPLKLIRAAREAGVPHCSVVTSQGANPNSWFLYMKTKGEVQACTLATRARTYTHTYTHTHTHMQMEEAVRQLNFPSVTIFRPGVLGRSNSRFGEKFAGNYILVEL